MLQSHCTVEPGLQMLFLLCLVITVRVGLQYTVNHIIAPGLQPVQVKNTFSGRSQWKTSMCLSVLWPGQAVKAVIHSRLHSHCISLLASFCLHLNNDRCVSSYLHIFVCWCIRKSLVFPQQSWVTPKAYVEDVFPVCPWDNVHVLRRVFSSAWWGDAFSRELWMPSLHTLSSPCVACFLSVIHHSWWSRSFLDCKAELAGCPCSSCIWTISM